MATATISVTYTATLDIGDVPTEVVKAHLEKDSSDSDFNIFECKGPITVECAEVVTA